MRLETDRLMLYLLGQELIDAAEKEGKHAFVVRGHTCDGELCGQDFYDAIPLFRETLCRNKGTRGFDSWIMVCKENLEIVGGIGFLGEPDADGVVEIGFATKEGYRQDYCIEAARKLIGWACGYDEVKRIISRCVPDDIASGIVLENLGFRVDRMDQEFMYWSYPG